MLVRSIRSALVLLCATVLGAGMLAAAPAQAASGTLTIPSGLLAFNSKGQGEVYAKCTSKTKCTGEIGVQGTPRTAAKAYSIPGKKAKWLAVGIHPDHPGNPYGPGTNLETRRTATLKYGSKTKTMNTERRRSSAAITGTVNGAGPTPTDVVVKLVGLGTNGTTSTKDRVIANPKGGTFSFAGLGLGRNNSPSSTGYKLQVTGTVDGEYRTWFWRGSDGSAKGGGRYSAEGSTIKVDKNGYVADVRYGQITGSTDGVGADITVAAPPTAYSKNARTLRAMDLPSCANIFGTARSNGTYRVGFLPYNAAAADNRYMVLAEDGSTNTPDLWNDKYGSCLDAMNYARQRANLIPLGPSTAAASKVQNFSPRPAAGKVFVDPKYSFGTNATDRFVRLREYVPGTKILDAKVFRDENLNADREKLFLNVPPGKYWVEVARKTSCTGWYPSRFADNRAYFKGVDRASEAWKTVAGAKAEFQKSINNGFPKNGRKPPKGYKGWMFRDYCAQTAAGKYKLVDVGGSEANDWKPSIGKGATISGRVTRTGGRSNKEMMVGVFSTGGVLVQRTAITNGSGRFTIRGLASGNYRVVVNPDSWRGIGRTFTGPKTKRVTAGKSYSVGTLKFKG